MFFAPLAAVAISFLSVASSAAAMPWSENVSALQARANTCHKAGDCKTSVAHAEAYCTKSHKCAWKCKKNYHKSGRKCVACTTDKQCKTSVKNASPVCSKNVCGFKCKTGFGKSGNSCKALSGYCGSTQCTPVIGGTNKCSKDHKCMPRCSKSGEVVYSSTSSKGKKTLKCFNVKSDPDNCGQPGNFCADGYNGKGLARCDNGRCSLKCPTDFTVRRNSKRGLYCAAPQASTSGVASGSGSASVIPSASVVSSVAPTSSVVHTSSVTPSNSAVVGPSGSAAASGH